MRLQRWLRQRWCGLIVGHMFTRHCDAESGWFGERCYFCEHRQRGIEVGPPRFTYVEPDTVVKRAVPSWLHSVHFGRKGA